MMLDLIISFGVSFFIFFKWDWLLKKTSTINETNLIYERIYKYSKVFLSERNVYDIFDKVKDFFISEQALEKVKSSNIEPIKIALKQAGFYHPRSMNYYFLCQFLLAFLGFWLGIFSINFFGIKFPVFYMKYLIAIFTSFSLFYLTDFFLRKIRDSRYKRIKENFSDFMELMIVCADSGLNVDSSLIKTTKEMFLINVELAKEIETTMLELEVLSDRRIAFNNLIERLDIQVVVSFVNVIIQTTEFGTSVAQNLRNLAKEERTEKALAAEKYAGRIPVLMTIPLVMFILPSLIIVVVGPGILPIMGMF